MKKTIYIILFILLFLNCNQKEKRINDNKVETIPKNEIHTNKKDSKWVGCYIYEEQPVREINNPAAETMGWYLELTANTSKLLISGFQTNKVYDCDYEIIENGINIIFLKEKYPPPKPLYKKGNILFQLKYNSKNELCTYWEKEEPKLANGKYENGTVFFVKKDCVEARKLINYDAIINF